MITINNIKQRLEYVEKILMLYQGEKEALQSLSTIYADVAYQDVRALEQLVEQQKPKPVVQQSPKPLVMMPIENTPVQKMLNSTSYRKVLDYIYNEVSDKNIISITIDAVCAKEIGVSSNTLSAIRNMMISTGRIIKSNKGKGLYTLSEGLIKEIEALED